jgi:WhiB family redox-sensing transcriptional regulator
MPSDEWEKRAACLDDDPEKWFPPVSVITQRTRDAIELCGWCPVRLDCLTVAIRDKHEEGIWGGLLPQQRKTLANRLKRKRSPLVLSDLDGLSA